MRSESYEHTNCFRSSVIFVTDLGSAVTMLAGVGNIQGVVRFLQLSEGRCLIDGTIDGLEPGPHGLHVHTLGDLTLDCLRWDRCIIRAWSCYGFYNLLLFFCLCGAVYCISTFNYLGTDAISRNDWRKKKSSYKSKVFF